MVQFFSFGPARSLCPVSASVSPLRALGLAAALVRRGALPALSVSRDSRLGLLVHADFSVPRSGWCRALMSFPLPRVAAPLVLAVAWVVGFPDRVFGARRDPFFPAPSWGSALWCAVRSPGVA